MISGTAKSSVRIFKLRTPKLKTRSSCSGMPSNQTSTVNRCWKHHKPKHATQLALLGQAQLSMNNKPFFLVEKQKKFVTWPTQKSTAVTARVPTVQNKTRNQPTRKSLRVRVPTHVHPSKLEATFIIDRRQLLRRINQT